MELTKNNGPLSINRRDFLKAAGIGAVAMSMPGLIRNTGAASMSNVSQEVIKTDVLVIGGGIAGVFAAIKAKEQGVDVTIADKGTVGKSGLSPWFSAYSYFDPSGSATKEQYYEHIASESEYLANMDYTKIFIEDSMTRYKELLDWGVKGDIKGGRGVIFRAQVKKNSVRLVERVMITDLLEKEGKVVGALGFPMEEDKAVIIKAKAVVLCAGSGAFKTPGFPASSLTHDGDAMAYKVGAEISGKEFIDFHWTHWEDPGDAYSNWKREWGMFHASAYTARGRRGPGPGGMAMQAHKGNVPSKMGRPGRRPRVFPGGSRIPPGCRSTDLPIVGGATAGMAPHKCEGIFPKDNSFASSVPGLFAAGDGLCTYGASYSGGMGSSSSGSATQGARAGRNAAEYAKNIKAVSASDSQISAIKKNIFEPRSREKGYSPEWVTQVLQGAMVPYYVLYIKKQDRLQAALANIKFMREHFAPNLLANDTHELRLAHEARNMLLNAEMKLRASLFRTESRGAHYREDYPNKDDKNWLAWVIISKDGDNMKLAKRPIPDAWKPKTKAYGDRHTESIMGGI
ncbi:MAG: FAD-binding protein [Deltaproteobacteria bacterium]|nr:FAD-binding protein [Deltaproteobacteria bacterium]